MGVSKGVVGVFVAAELWLDFHVIVADSSTKAVFSTCVHHFAKVAASNNACNKVKMSQQKNDVGYHDKF